MELIIYIFFNIFFSSNYTKIKKLKLGIFWYPQYIFLLTSRMERRYHPYRPPAGSVRHPSAGSARPSAGFARPSAGSVRRPSAIMGYYFPFQVGDSTESTLTGKYGSPVHEKIIPSKCGMKNPIPTKQLVNELCHHDIGEVYLLGIKYDGKGRSKNDSQPTITGKAKYGESFVDAARREIAEEIGGYCNLSGIKPLISIKNEIEIHTFVVNVSRIVPVVRVPAKSKAPDDYKRRVEIVFFGTIVEFESVLRQIRIRSREETDIMGVMAYPFDDAM